MTLVAAIAPNPGAMARSPALLASFNFDASTLAAVSDNGVAASNLSLSNITSSFVSVNSNMALSVVCSAISAATAISGNQYFQTTITGSGLTLANIAFKGAMGSAASARGVAIRSSADSFASTIAADTFTTAVPAWTVYSHPMSIPVGAGLTLRFYTWRSDSVATLRFDDIILTFTA
jgi:hypothetical protein